VSYTIHHGSALSVLQGMADKSVHCCVTSPPYFGLRDYGVDGQIGLEKTPDEFVAKLVEVFREVRRVLRDDGTCWVNLGDSYCSQGGPQVAQTKWQVNGASDGQNGGASRAAIVGLKPKDLIGIPWRVAFALQADGWYLRSDIIWHKPNPMPESVTDRPTKAHEYLFLLAKSERYFFDSDAIAESAKYPGDQGFLRGPVDGCDSENVAWRAKSQQDRKLAGVDSKTAGKATRNKRTVWTLATQATPDAHFATFPIELPETCIKAACPEDGIVLDPFAGSGTTGLAAIKNGRRFVGIELNVEYIGIARNRLMRHYPLLAQEPSDAA
jgi:DNA modification methylase